MVSNREDGIVIPKHRLTEFGMVQESVSWDPQTLIREPSVIFKIYLLFLVVVCATTTMKVVRIWRAVPPFRRVQRVNDPTYAKLVRTAGRSLLQWIGCTFFAWGILVATTLHEVSSGMMNEKVSGRLMILFEVRDFSTALGLTLWITLYVFLVRWHVVVRIEDLST